MNEDKILSQVSAVRLFADQFLGMREICIPRRPGADQAVC
jgi:hypothetical protein